MPPIVPKTSSEWVAHIQSERKKGNLTGKSVVENEKADYDAPADSIGLRQILVDELGKQVVRNWTWGHNLPLDKADEKLGVAADKILRKILSDKDGVVETKNTAIKSRDVTIARLENELKAEQNKTPAAAESTTAPQEDTKGKIELWHLIAVTAVGATLTGLLIFLMMEHSKKKTLKAVTQLKQQNAQLQQAVQSANADSSGGYGGDSSNQSLGFAA